MERNVIKQLLAWKQKKNRKPLIVNGARQVGKTYILREFGAKFYQKMAYVNCDGIESHTIFIRGTSCEGAYLEKSR